MDRLIVPLLIVAAALRRLNRATQSQLREVTGVSQEQISRDLRDLNVTENVEKRGARGRPAKVYELATPKDRSGEQPESQ